MDVPRTLLVTNDYPPSVGGIQRTLEALVRELPPDRISVFCPSHDDGAEFDARAPYRVLRQAERFMWPTPDVGERLEAAVRASRAEVVLFGATYPLAMLGPRLANAGVPYLSAAHARRVVVRHEQGAGHVHGADILPERCHPSPRPPTSSPP